MTGTLDAVIRQAHAARYDRVSVHPSLHAIVNGVAQRTDLRLTPWTHEADDEWSAIMVGADEDDEVGAEGDARLILTAAPTATRWRAAVIVPGRSGQPPAEVVEAVEDTIGRAMSRAENIAWTLVHRDPTLATAEREAPMTVRLNRPSPTWREVTDDVYVRRKDTRRTNVVVEAYAAIGTTDLVVERMRTCHESVVWLVESEGGETRHGMAEDIDEAKAAAEAAAYDLATGIDGGGE